MANGEQAGDPREELVPDDGSPTAAPHPEEMKATIEFRVRKIHFADRFASTCWRCRRNRELPCRFRTRRPAGGLNPKRGATVSSPHGPASGAGLEDSRRRNCLVINTSGISAADTRSAAIASPAVWRATRSQQPIWVPAPPAVARGLTPVAAPGRHARLSVTRCLATCANG